MFDDRTGAGVIRPNGTKGQAGVRVASSRAQSNGASVSGGGSRCGREKEAGLFPEPVLKGCMRSRALTLPGVRKHKNHIGPAHVRCNDCGRKVTIRSIRSGPEDARTGLNGA